MSRPVPQSIIDAAQAAQRKWRVPASVSIAQWALESAWGTHMPPDSNNPFGIKAVPGQPSVTVKTREVLHGRSVIINAPFRKFNSIADAFDAHGQLLATSPAYAKARQHEQFTPAADDQFGNSLTGVYATDPNYGTLLRSIMHGGNLYQYDIQA